jgi:NADH:flavin oxidoreductase / NADH oxidase family
MPPLTRLRADADDSPSDIMVTHYEQRASKGGLIIIEAASVSNKGSVYQGSPGIYDDRHIAGFRKIADAVHAKGGVVFVSFRADRPQFPLAALLENTFPDVGMICRGSGAGVKALRPRSGARRRGLDSGPPSAYALGHPGNVTLCASPQRSQIIDWLAADQSALLSRKCQPQIEKPNSYLLPLWAQPSRKKLFAGVFSTVESHAEDVEHRITLESSCHVDGCHRKSKRVCLTRVLHLLRSKETCGQKP